MSDEPDVFLGAPKWENLPDVDKLQQLIDQLEHTSGLHTQNRINYEETGRQVTALRQQIREWTTTYRREHAQ